MKIEVVSQVTYCVDDLKKMLKYEDLKGELLPLPDDAVVSIQDGEVTARVAGLILSSAQPNRALRVRELKAKIEAAHRANRKRPYHRGALERAVEYSNGLTLSADACLIFDQMSGLGAPFTVKEIIEHTKIHSNERVRNAMKLLCKVEAARRISLKEAKQSRAELKVEWPHNRSVLWELTDKFMVDQAPVLNAQIPQNGTGSEVSDES